jgi:hypothetical protein
LQTIETAVLVINLDDGTPDTLTEHITQTMLNDGVNRWFDKPMQFVVTANGRSSVILEHSRIDGVTALSLLYLLHDHIQAYKTPLRNGVNGTHTRVSLAKEMPLITNPAIDAHIATLRATFADMLPQREFITHVTTQFGKNFLINNGMPIKGVAEATIQLASRLYHGWSPESWEGVSLSHFHKGRHDMIQTVSGPVADFCASATDESVPLAQRRQALVQAADNMTANVKNAMQGKGFFRLINVIKELWPADEARPAYFDHPIIQRIMTYTLVVTMLDPVAPGAAAMPANPEAIRIRYGVGDDE